MLGTEEDVAVAPRGLSAGWRAAEGRCTSPAARDPYFPPWTDVAQLNYFNPETRAAMRRRSARSRRIATACAATWRCSCSTRCSSARGGPAARRLADCPRRILAGARRQRCPSSSCIAEVYWDLEGVLLDQGFTFAYDKRLLDALHAPDAAPPCPPSAVADSPPATGLARFLENHDEPRSAATLPSRVPAAARSPVRFPACASSSTASRTAAYQPPVQLARWPDEPARSGASASVRACTCIRVASRVLHEGEWKLLEISAAGDDTCRDIVAYRWRSAGALAVVAVNLGDASSQAHLALADDLPPGDAFDLRRRAHRRAVSPDT